MLKNKRLAEPQNVPSSKYINPFSISVEEFNQLQTKYNGIEQKLQNVNKDIDRLNAENKEYNKMNNMVKNENVSLVEKIKQISKENESLKQQKNAKEREQDVEMDKLQKERDGYLKRMNTLKAINKKLSEFHDKELNELKTKRESDLAQITALNEKIVSNQAQIDKMQTESKNRKDFIVKMKELLTKKGNVLTSKQQTIEKMQKNEKDKMNEIVSLKLALQKAINTEKTLKSEMEIKIKQLSDNMASLKQEKDAEIACLNNDKKSLSEQIKKEKEEHEEFNQLHRQHIDGLLESSQSKDGEINKLQAKNIKMKGLMTKMKEAYNSKKAIIEKLQNEMSALKTKRETDLAQIAALNEDKQLLSEQFEKEKQENKEINELHRQHIDRLLERSQSMENEINKLQAENTKTRGLLTETKQLYNSNQAIIEKLKIEMWTLKSSSDKVIVDKERNHKLLIDKMQKLEIENKKLMTIKENNSKNAVTLNVAKICEDYENEISEKSDTIKSLKTKIKAIKKDKMTIIYEKLIELKSILSCDLSDGALLDYLLKADLNLDSAINLHFQCDPSHNGIAIQKPSNNDVIENQINRSVMCICVC